ncbi:MAG: M18 family aminopeptidase [Bullifex sp.]
MNQYMKDTEEMTDFIRRSPSPYHVVHNIEEELLKSGFERLSEKKTFETERGHSYYVTRNSSSLIAFRVPERFTGFSIAAAHTDSPCFRIKPSCESVSHGYTRLNIEKYGGMLMAPWFDRPLSIGGRVFVNNGGKAEERLFETEGPAVSIVNLAIHQNREANNGIKYSVQKEMMPIFAQDAPSGSFRSFVASRLGISEDDILDWDLCLSDTTPPSIWGLDGEFFSSPRIDDLQCAHSAFRALKETKPSDRISMIALFDNEEVGSGTGQGALSDFLSAVTDRILLSLGISGEERYMHYASSFMISADNGHAVHPNYAEKSDITTLPRLNGGILIKYSANQKYTTDASTGSELKALLTKNGIPYQVFVNNSDVTGGSTLGNLSIQKLSVRTADIGVAQLAMHSPYECGGTRDTTALLSLFRAFLSL